jgi:hypothetical protein
VPGAIGGTLLFDQCQAIYEKENQWCQDNAVLWTKKAAAARMTSDPVRHRFFQVHRDSLTASFALGEANNLSAWEISRQVAGFERVAQFSGKKPGTVSVKDADGNLVRLAITADLMEYFPKSPGFDSKKIRTSLRDQIVADGAHFSWLLSATEAGQAMSHTLMGAFGKGNVSIDGGNISAVHICPFCPCAIKGDKAAEGHVLRAHMKVRPACCKCLTHYKQLRGLKNHTCAQTAGPAGQLPCDTRPITDFDSLGRLISQ